VVDLMGFLALLEKALGGGYSNLPAINGDPVRVLGTPEREMKFTGLIDDVRAAITVRTLIHGPGASSSGWSGGDANSAVFACLMALSKAYIEPPLRVYKKLPDGERDHLPDHQLQLLLNDPHPFISAAELGWWVQWCKNCDGNAYLRKIRAGNEDTGNVVQLQPISPRLIGPVSARGEYLTAYKYEYESGRFEFIPPHNVVHYRLGIDDRDHRLGLAPLKRLAREVSSDDTANAWTAALLKNNAVPGLVVTWDKETASISRDQAEEIKERVNYAFSGENAGRTAVLQPGGDLKQFGFSPEQLNLEAIHTIPESRIAAVMGVPAAVAMLMIGLQQTSNYASMREVREMFAEGTLIPQWTLDEAKLNHQLVPDFDARRGIEVAFDLSEVRALQEDVNEQYKRLDLAVQGGWVLPNEARQEVGFEPRPEFDKLPEPVVPAVNEDEDEEAPVLRIVKALEAKQFTPEALPALFSALADLAEPGLRRDLEAFMDGQRRRIKSKLLSG
jgi:HK97 family phage portal protein